MTLETILENGVGLREELEEEDKKNFPFHIQALERTSGKKASESVLKLGDVPIAVKAREIYQKAKVMDSQEIWNILREESEARLARIEMSHSWHTVIESFNERMECRKLMELQGRSQSHRSRVALMFKASESNLDRTTLLMANNPLPDLHSHQEGDSPTKYLANDILAQPKRLASIGGPLKGLPPLMKPSKVPSQKQKKLSIPHRALSEVPTSVCVQISENWSMVSDKDIKEEGITSDTDINEFWNPI
ncbi:uncharacterized protein LOC124469328 isoform X2 [Hypomesus transpacificus]|uniref:uncharacterized protein LOC124469328 isoform X2 n=1 Tax=Hypomesus transpacificus TaxID=137520 RepID=UPI001F075612|nr:uncharacterized protein LOC124469328 isoform X2 [Hypomesus transpacificus]